MRKCLFACQLHQCLGLRLSRKSRFHQQYRDPTLAQCKGHQDLPPYCPYAKGAKLSLEFTNGGCTTDSGRKATATILHPFLPFTQSQALKVQVNNNDKPRSALPTILVLKLFDRRFLDRGTFERPWKSSVECSFRKILEEYHYGGGELPEFDWHDSDPDDWEDWMHECVVENRMRSNLRAERKAYTHLKSLQGNSIPRYYGSFRCRVEGAQPNPFADVMGIALEFIEGIPVDEYKKTKQPTIDEGDRLAQASLTIMRKLRDHKVLHGDIRCGNLLVRKGDNSPILIDFSLTKLREDYASEEAWEEDIEAYQEIQELRQLLNNEAIYEATPNLLPVEPYWGYGRLNTAVSFKSKRWRDKFFDEIKRKGPDHKIVYNPKGEPRKYEFARYRLKKGARTTEGDKW